MKRVKEKLVVLKNDGLYFLMDKHFLCNYSPQTKRSQTLNRQLVLHPERCAVQCTV